MASAIREVPNGAKISTPKPELVTRPATVCVFCGASPGNSPAHLAAARALAQTLHANNMHLVYGGGTVGLMGELAKTLVSLSGPDSVHGIIPRALMKFERNTENEDESIEALEKVIDVSKFGRTTVVADMHTRKQMMAEEVMTGGPGGGFVALSGGYGTLEELMEIVTWNQLGIHEKGIVVFNVEGYYDGLLQWVRKAVESGFIGKSNQGIMVEAKEAEEVLRCLKGYENAKGRFKLSWGQN